jgi:GH24 family phage-related lysozyme (muramidase)
VVIGQSGVTIGRGLDLGQHNEQDLRKYRLPEALHQKLVPGLGVKGNAAIEFVAKNKIVLTDEEEAILAEALHARTTQRARDGFASSPHNTQRVKFEELPPYVQTVVYSMTMNMGEDAFVTPKITMRAIASGDYQAAANELLEGNWKAPLPRRRSEGRYLKEQLQKNGLWIGR